MRFTGLQIDTNKLLCLYGELIDEIYGKVYEVVRRNGGIVDMSDPELDNAYALVYTGDREGVETQITAVRANEDGSLDIQVAYYDDEWLSFFHDRFMANVDSHLHGELTQHDMRATAYAEKGWEISLV